MYCRNCGEFMNDIQDICLKCGVAKGAGDQFCPNCGNLVSPEADICVNCGISLKAQQNNVNRPNTDGITRRSIILAIIFSFITCGIYGVYWFIVLTNDMNKASGKTNDTSGGLAFLFSLITCGIYEFYWTYKLGQKRDIVADEKDYSGILYLVLAILGFGIIPFCLAQDTINKAIDRNSKK